MPGPFPTPASESEERKVEPAGTCAEQVAADERALRLAAPCVRVTVVAAPAVSFGVGVREDAPYVVRARSAGIPVVRRRSGGTGVLHAPGDLLWSLVLPRTDPRVGRDFVRGYARLGAGVVRFLDSYGVRARWGPPPGRVPDYCVLSARGEVLGVGPRVLGGAAQHLSRSALLHQGMVPLTVDREQVARIFDIGRPEELAPLVGLRELGVSASPEALAHRLATELEHELDGPDR